MALVGAPNAGKSTLVNRIVGKAVAIVTHKAQTTRRNVRGIVMHRGAQVVLTDTPGLCRPARERDRLLLRAAWGAIEEADIVAVITDAARTRPLPRDVLTRLSEHDADLIAILNKIDLVRRERLLAAAEKLNAEVPFAATFMVSAKTGDGVADVCDWLAARMPKGPLLFPLDAVTDLPPGDQAAEVTREQALLRLHEEIPYRLDIKTTACRARADGSCEIRQVLYVAEPRHRRIVLGEGARTLKAISSAARHALEELWSRRVHLFVEVRVMPDRSLPNDDIPAREHTAAPWTGPTPASS